jgi:hypothetical protein
MKESLPIPVCSTCQAPGSSSYSPGDTTYCCSNCGTEMRYLPAGELLMSGGSEVKKNNGWITKFSVLSSERSTGQAILGLGVLILVLALSFFGSGRTGADGALWSGGSGLLLVMIGLRKTVVHKRKVLRARRQYPYWHN